MHQETSYGDVVLPFQDQVILFLVGELDVASGPRLLALTRDLLHSGASTIVLVLPTVSFLASSGLEHLMTLHDRLLAAGRPVTVPTPSPAVVRLLEKASMTHLITSVTVPASLPNA